MPPILKIHHLSKSFGEKKVLKDINLTVEPGQIIGYIGPNGAGKSTTVKIMLGLIEEYEGDIEIFGENIKNADPSYKLRIGYVPESGDIYDNLTAKEYLTFIGALCQMDEKEAEEKSKALMGLFAIEEFYNARINSFSKGMKQKVLIIAALLNNPDILFLDEPLSGVDANSVLVVKEILKALSQRGKTIFYSSHIMEVVEKLSERIILIKDGEIIADGSMEKLKQSLPETSLEEIFNKLTGFSQHEKIAQEFVSIIEEGQAHERI